MCGLTIAFFNVFGYYPVVIDVFTIAVINDSKSPIHYFNNHVGTGSKRHDELLHNNINSFMSSEVDGLKFISFISVSVSFCLSSSSQFKLALMISISS